MSDTSPISNLSLLDRGAGCNITQLAMNDFDTVQGNPNLLANKGVRFAISAAINKPSYISGFYAGEAVVADSWLCPLLQARVPADIQPERVSRVPRRSRRADQRTRR